MIDNKVKNRIIGYQQVLMKIFMTQQSCISTIAQEITMDKLI